MSILKNLKVYGVKHALKYASNIVDLEKLIQYIKDKNFYLKDDGNVYLIYKNNTDDIEHIATINKGDKVFYFNNLNDFQNLFEMEDTYIGESIFEEIQPL